MSQSFFRKAALEKLSTPEKLDQLIKVTGTKSWIALVAIGLALIVAITWSFSGNIKTKLNVAGVLLGSEVYEIVSTAQGQLIKLNVKLGDKIKEGDIIAHIEQVQLHQQIEEARSLLAEHQFELSRMRSFGSQDVRLQSDYIAKQRSSIESQIGTEKKMLTFLKNQLETEKDLKIKGLITASQLANTEQQVEATANQIENLKAQLSQTLSQKLNVKFDSDQRENVLQQRIAQTERQIEQLNEQYDLLSNIRSPYSGEVVEVLTDAGIIVGQGAPLFKIKNHSFDNANLRGILYIPAQDGKKIEVGMEALVAPSTVKPQDFGFMKGRVTYVSDFPITQKGMMTSVKNDQLVQSLLGMGAPFEVHVTFEKDAGAYSGFKWTSAKGPDIFINEGTSCIGKVTVKNEPPVAIVIPALRKFFDLY